MVLCFIQSVAFSSFTVCVLISFIFPALNTILKIHFTRLYAQLKLKKPEYASQRAYACTSIAQHIIKQCQFDKWIENWHNFLFSMIFRIFFLFYTVRITNFIEIFSFQTNESVTLPRFYRLPLHLYWSRSLAIVIADFEHKILCYKILSRNCRCNRCDDAMQTACPTPCFRNIQKQKPTNKNVFNLYIHHELSITIITLIRTDLCSISFWFSYLFMCFCLSILHIVYTMPFWIISCVGVYTHIRTMYKKNRFGKYFRFHIAIIRHFLPLCISISFLDFFAFFHFCILPFIELSFCLSLMRF